MMRRPQLFKLGKMQKGATLLLLIAAVAGVLLLSSGLATTDISKEWQLFQDEEEDERPLGNSDGQTLFDRLPTLPDSFWMVLYMAAVILIPLAIVLSLFSREMRRAILDELKKAVPFAIWIAVFIFLIRRWYLQNSRTAPPADLPQQPPMPDWISNPSALLAFTVGFFLIAIIAVACWLIWRRTRQKDPLTQLAYEAQSTITALQKGDDFHNTIIQCYARMCQIVYQEKRIQRAQGTTPQEFANRLSQLAVGGKEVQQLTQLFEKVRYGGIDANKQDEAAAIACLQTVTNWAPQPPEQPLIWAPAKTKEWR